MSMIRKIDRVVMLSCLCICMLMGAMTLQVNAAEENTYTVTYRPGNIARFREQLYAGYVAEYGETRYPAVMPREVLKSQFLRVHPIPQRRMHRIWYLMMHIKENIM